MLQNPSFAPYHNGVPGIMVPATSGSLMGNLVPPQQGVPKIKVGFSTSNHPTLSQPQQTMMTTMPQQIMGNYAPQPQKIKIESGINVGGGIVPPSQQLGIISQHISRPIPQHRDVGPVVLGLHNKSMMPSQQGSLFFKQYHVPQHAQNDHAQALMNRDGVMQQIAHKMNQDVSQLGPCTVFPPLLVRFFGEKDTFIPVQVLQGGEIHDTEQVPDFILNFHTGSSGITLTVCQIPNERYFNFELAVTALYAMHSEQPLTLQQFVKLYDQSRMQVMDHLKQYALNQSFR